MVESVYIDLEDIAEEPAGEFTHCFTGECRINVLPVLFRISQIIINTEDLEDSLKVILAVLRDNLRMRSGVVSLYDRSSERFFIHKSFGMEAQPGAEAAWQDIALRASDAGKAVIQVQRGRAAPDPASGIGATVFCAPIVHGRKVLGTICVERTYLNRRLLRQDAELMMTIAAMIGPMVECYLLENVDRVRLQTENSLLRSALKERYKPSNIIGTSKPMLEVYELIHKVAATKATVLVLGESGVGKELIAHAIHYQSASSQGPLVKFNCAALPENIVESELFGHEKGSFTGASAQRKGRFEVADGGTIFLDEVGELSLPIQAKLLRVLQERCFERVGGNAPVRVDVRIIAATNRDLQEMVAKGTFREDLYYRLNVFPITIPPLRERGSDIILLADHFVAKSSISVGKDVKRISTPAINMLMSYHWPGNVRELENVIERSVILAADGVIHGYNLPPSLQTAKETGTAFGCGLEEKLRSVEYEMIVEAMKNHHGNMTEAAKELGLTRRILGLRMEKYRISYKAFRHPELVGQ